MAVRREPGILPDIAGIVCKSTTIYGHEIEMYTVEQGEKRDKRQ
jgi:hypothetical protein